MSDATIRDVLRGLDTEKLEEIESVFVDGRSVAGMSLSELAEIEGRLTASTEALLEKMRTDGAEIEKMANDFYLHRFEWHMRMLADRPDSRHLIDAFRSIGESAVVKASRFFMARGWFSKFIPHTEYDKVVFEYGLGRGRADIVIFHLDGSITVVEAKDGDQGVRSVLGGIGQVGYYAAQLGARNTGMKVRRALLWTSTGDPAQDALIPEACEVAGVVSMEIKNVAAIKSDINKGILDLIDAEVADRKRAAFSDLTDDEKALLRRIGVLPDAGSE